jgi:hypothetical protein
MCPNRINRLGRQKSQNSGFSHSLTLQRTGGQWHVAAQSLNPRMEGVLPPPLSGGVSASCSLNLLKCSRGELGRELSPDGCLFEEADDLIRRHALGSCFVHGNKLLSETKESLCCCFYPRLS